MAQETLNNPREGSAVRRPRGRVTLNGTVIPGWIDFEIQNNANYQADRFRCRFAGSKMPPEYGAAFWSREPVIQLEFEAGFQADPNATPVYESLLIGNVDDVDWDWRTQVLLINGRDRTSELIETKTTEKYENQTSSQIAEALAKKHGLQAQVQATTALAGTYYEIEHAQLTHESTEWDLLTYLAQQEGFQVFVRGNTLFFQKAADETNPGPAYIIEYRPPTAERIASGNFITLRTRRNLLLARDVIVEVNSWNIDQAAGFKRSVRSKNLRRASQLVAPAQTYSFTLPDATTEEVLKFAQEKAKEITQHERLVEIDAPAENPSVITTTTPVQLTGTGTDWDQLYFPDTITRRLDIRGGYRMTLRAKNHSPQSTVATP